MTSSAVRDLVKGGGYAEITAYQLFHQPGFTAAMLAQVAQAAGGGLILSSDAGQPDTPAAPEALTFLVDALAKEGLDRSWLNAAASQTPSALFRPR